MKNTEGTLIDVRESDEFQSEHIPGAHNLPLSQIDHEAKHFLQSNPSQRIVLVCRSGKRAKLAQIRLEQLGLLAADQCEVLEGGLLGWKHRGGTTQKPSVKRALPLPVMQQVQIIVGTSILISCIGAVTLSLNFLFIGGLLGAGLVFAGFSGRCLMAEALLKLPFNRPPF